MQRFRFLAILFLVPALAFLIAGGGCKGKKSGDTGSGPTDGEPEENGKEEKRTPLKVPDKGTLKGVAYFKGTPPPVGDNKFEGTDEKTCNEGDMKMQFWKIDKASKKIANVVISLNPPAGKYFEIKDLEVANVTVDQPHCAFIPHVSVAFPEKYDPNNKKADKKGRVPTGQKVTVHNGATIKHNTRWFGSPTTNPAKTNTINPGTDDELEKLKVDTRPIELHCDLHKFMSGYVLTFEHPYAAVSQEKNELTEKMEKKPDVGTFEIKDVPAGVEVLLKGWHEKAEKITAKVNGKDVGDIKKGAPVTLKKGENVIEIEVAE
jgi:hypothetical protein